MAKQDRLLQRHRYLLLVYRQMERYLRTRRRQWFCWVYYLPMWFVFCRCEDGDWWDDSFFERRRWNWLHSLRWTRWLEDGIEWGLLESFEPMSVERLDVSINSKHQNWNVTIEKMSLSKTGWNHCRLVEDFGQIREEDKLGHNNPNPGLLWIVPLPIGSLKAGSWMQSRRNIQSRICCRQSCGIYCCLDFSEFYYLL